MTNDKRFKEIADMDAKSRLHHTMFAVEATSFETLCLWDIHANDLIAAFPRKRKWEQVNPGYSVTVGQIDNRPICISMFWVFIDDQLVVFWETTSQVVDTLQIEQWMSSHFSAKWDKGTRSARTNADNFNHCLRAIDEANVKGDS